MIVVEIDFAWRLGDARDQGSRPTCLVFAASGLNAFANGVGHLSAEFLCHHAAQLAPNWKPGRGFQMDEVLSAVAFPGQPLEEHYPYEPNIPEAPLVVPAGIFELHTSKCGRHFDIQCSEIATRVLAGQAIGIVIQMARSIWTPQSGIIDFDPMVIPDQYHALIVVGVGQHSGTGEKYMLLRNSWGTSWGINGHAWISLSHLNLVLIEGFLI
jgi:hypothetical protein